MPLSISHRSERQGYFDTASFPLGLGFHFGQHPNSFVVCDRHPRLPSDLLNRNVGAETKRFSAEARIIPALKGERSPRSPSAPPKKLQLLHTDSLSPAPARVTPSPTLPSWKETPLFERALARIGMPTSRLQARLFVSELLTLGTALSVQPITQRMLLRSLTNITGHEADLPFSRSKNTHYSQVLRAYRSANSQTTSLGTAHRVDQSSL